jgi:hypothetical protein|uniref:Uncharacterized protein n=1 Tax=Myoviridae sp. ctshb19 TaxID=2825194 RepID=A0A8S5UH64_9CAUD|nr:MAG TPA: hypothetical protein [Myoviridae sp. ctshb19]
MVDRETLPVEDFEKMRHDFLKHYIFCPKEVELSEDYHRVLLSLNVWPLGTMIEQHRAMLKRKEFTLGNTLFKTGYAQTTIISRANNRHTLEQQQ